MLLNLLPHRTFLCRYSYGHIEPALKLLDSAGRTLGLEVELTGKWAGLDLMIGDESEPVRNVELTPCRPSSPGAMGKRTVHQVDAKAQLVVLATRNREAALAACSGAGPLRPPGEVASILSAAMGGTDFSRAELGLDPHSPSTNEGAPGAASAEAGGEAGGGPKKEKETAGLAEEADVFVAPVLIGEDGQVSCLA